jgi:hypothetical protein
MEIWDDVDRSVTLWKSAMLWTDQQRCADLRCGQTCGAVDIVTNAVGRYVCVVESDVVEMSDAEGICLQRPTEMLIALLSLAAGLPEDWCLSRFAPTFLGLVQSGFYAATAGGLRDYCTRAIVLADNATFDSEFSQYQCAAGADTCCPTWGLMYSKEQCSARTNDLCQPRGECATATDSCYMAYQTSAAAGSPLCPATCNRIPYSGTVGLYQAVQEGGAGMLCYNASQWQACAAADEASCGLMQDSMHSNLCAFKQSCAIPPLAEFGCADSADQCCLPSSTPVFSEALKAQCSSASSFTSLKCKVAGECVQAVDPCKQHSTPWDCGAQAGCTFMPNGDSNSNFGATCISTVDPCRGTSPAMCGQQQVLLGAQSVSRCHFIDRCTTSFCDGTDACCALSGDYDRCRASATGCTDDSRCIPEVDTCKPLSEASCQGYCRWNSTSSRCSLDVAGHPCSAIKDPYACHVSDHQCLLVPLCVNQCRGCDQCLADVYAHVVVAAQATLPGTSGPTAAANIFSDWCR